MLRKTKLVCTIGPGSRSSPVIRKLIRAGMSVARLNFAHDTPEEHLKVIRTIRDVSAAMAAPVAILLDLPGAKLRTGELVRPKVQLKEGSAFTLTTEKVAGDERRVSVPPFFRDIKPGDTIYLNDGAIELKVTSVTAVEARCRVVVGGSLIAHRGINVPGVRLSVSSFTGEDLRDLAFGVEQGVDFFAVSFVRSAADIRQIREILRQKRASIPLIAKIEKHEAVKDIDQILAEADGAMVARGDLGIEIPLEKVPIVQKEIVRKCNLLGKPVVVATQMLESMISSVRPTRAEVSDVANAIFDGADAVMLSGETAIGKFPVPSVKMMASIAAETEKTLPYERALLEKGALVTAKTDDAISYAACHMAQTLRAACIVAYTTSGSTALRVSKYRPRVPILAITPHPHIARRLVLSWGVHPYIAAEPVNIDMMFQEATRVAFKAGMARRGDLIVITAGIPMGKPGTTNVVKVQRVE
ncbi:MAG: pyruvate kinase [Chloroflexota bacterium]|nr:pyruvate kinase [Chloroflexota bacterium]